MCSAMAWESSHRHPNNRALRFGLVGLDRSAKGAFQLRKTGGDGREESLYLHYAIYRDQHAFANSRVVPEDYES